MAEEKNFVDLTASGGGCGFGGSMMPGMPAGWAPGMSLDNLQMPENWHPGMPVDVSLTLPPQPPRPGPVGPPLLSSSVLPMGGLIGDVNSHFRMVPSLSSSSSSSAVEQVVADVSIARPQGVVVAASGGDRTKGLYSGGVTKTKTKTKTTTSTTPTLVYDPETASYCTPEQMQNNQMLLAQNARASGMLLGGGMGIGGVPPMVPGMMMTAQQQQGNALPWTPAQQNAGGLTAGVSHYQNQYSGSGNYTYTPCVGQEQITLSLHKMQEFVATAESGAMPKAIISLIKSEMPEKIFDKEIRKWKFPISQHQPFRDMIMHWNQRPLTGRKARSIFVHLVPIPQVVINMAMAHISGVSSTVGEDDIGGGVAGKTQTRLKTPENSRKVLRDHHVPSQLISAMADFQQQGAAFIVGACKGRALLADEMGLGKTIQATAAISAFVHDWPLLIICPSCARFHWKKEMLQWLGPGGGRILTENQVQVVTSSKDALARVTIISYDLVGRMESRLMQGPGYSHGGNSDGRFGAIIVDESHYLKNPNAKRTLAVKRLCQHAGLPPPADPSAPQHEHTGRILMLSGTPAMAKPIELFEQLNILDPNSFGSRDEYGRRYCQRRKRKDGKVQEGVGLFGGASNMQELHIRLCHGLMCRRYKKDILKGSVPPKERIFKTIHLSVTERERLNALQNGRVDPKTGEVDQSRRAVLLGMYGETGRSKVEAAVAEMHALMQQRNAGKLCVFAHHRVVLDALERAAKERNYTFMRIDGRTPPLKRAENVERFQNQSQTRLALLGITAAGMAITLTAASTMLFTEFFWTPAMLLQAEDRCHRIGQTAVVKIVYLRAKGTIDDKLIGLLEKKMKVLGEFVEGAEGSFQAKEVDLTGDDDGSAAVASSSSSSLASASASALSTQDESVFLDLAKSALKDAGLDANEMLEAEEVCNDYEGEGDFIDDSICLDDDDDDGDAGGAGGVAALMHNNGYPHLEQQGASSNLGRSTCTAVNLVDDDDDGDDAAPIATATVINSFHCKYCKILGTNAECQATGNHHMPNCQRYDAAVDEFPMVAQRPPADTGAGAFAGPAQTAAGDGGIPWAIRNESASRDYFHNLGPYDGKLSFLKVKSIFDSWYCSEERARQIWRLADVDGDGLVDVDEFAVVMHFCSEVSTDAPLPSALPIELTPPSKRAPVGPPALESKSDDDDDRPSKRARLSGHPTDLQQDGAGSSAAFVANGNAGGVIDDMDDLLDIM